MPFGLLDAKGTVVMGSAADTDEECTEDADEERAEDERTADTAGEGRADTSDDGKAGTWTLAAGAATASRASKMKSALSKRARVIKRGMLLCELR